MRFLRNSGETSCTLGFLAQATLYDSVKMLVENHIHRVCVVQPILINTVLCVLSHHRVLNFLSKQVHSMTFSCQLMRDITLSVAESLSKYF